MTCKRCGSPLTGKQQRWCSKRCADAAWSAVRRTIISRRGRAGSSGRVGVEQITDAKLAEVKRRFPSCARDWDLAMVEKAWPRLTTLLPRRLNQIDAATRRPLSDRELEVVRHVADGESNEEIGTALGISVCTVKTHLARATAFFGATNRAAVAAIALRQGVID